MVHFSSKMADLYVEAGWFKKTTIDATIYFQNSFAGIPVVLITSEWEEAGVGCVETLKSVSATGFSVHSCNRKDNYYVNWMAIGVRSGIAPPSKEMADALAAFRALDRDAEPTKEHVPGDEPAK